MIWKSKHCPPPVSSGGHLKPHSNLSTGFKNQYRHRQKIFHTIKWKPSRQVFTTTEYKSRMKMRAQRLSPQHQLAPARKINIVFETLSRLARRGGLQGSYIRRSILSTTRKGKRERRDGAEPTSAVSKTIHSIWVRRLELKSIKLT